MYDDDHPSLKKNETDCEMATIVIIHKNVQFIVFSVGVVVLEVWFFYCQIAAEQKLSSSCYWQAAAISCRSDILLLLLLLFSLFLCVITNGGGNRRRRSRRL